MAERGPVMASELATAMRAILRAARWHPDDDPGAVIATLTVMYRDIAALLTDDDAALTILEDDALANIYAFSGAVQKTVNQDHPAQHPDRRSMPADQFVADTAQQFPQLHQKQLALLAELDALHPPAQ